MDTIEVDKKRYIQLQRLIKVWIALTLLLSAMMLFEAFLLHQASNGDINHDGKIDSLDLSIVLSHMPQTKNTSYHMSSSVPMTFTLPVQTQPGVQNAATVNAYQDTATVNQLQ